MITQTVIGTYMHKYLMITILVFLFFSCTPDTTNDESYTLIKQVALDSANSPTHTFLYQYTDNGDLSSVETIYANVVGDSSSFTYFEYGDNGRIWKSYYRKEDIGTSNYHKMYFYDSLNFLDSVKGNDREGDPVYSGYYFYSSKNGTDKNSKLVRYINLMPTKDTNYIKEFEYSVTGYRTKSTRYIYGDMTHFTMYNYVDGVLDECKSYNDSGELISSRDFEFRVGESNYNPLNYGVW